MTVSNIGTGQLLLERLDRLEPGRPHHKLMFQGGLGYTFDSFDGQLMGYALAAVIVVWHIDPGQSGWLLSSIFFGYLVGAVLAGILADRFGRRRLMMFALSIFCVFSLLLATSTGTTQLFIWRALSGVGIGAETTLIAPYISEFLPARYRGRFVARTVGFLAFGYVLAGIVAPLVIAPRPTVGWRYAAVIAAAPVVLLLWWRKTLPESPRFLISRGRIEEAAAVVERFERESGVDPRESPAREPAPGVDLEPTPRPVAIEATKQSVARQLATLWSGPLARVTIVLWLLWFILIGVNYGFSSWLPAFLVIAKGFTITKSFIFTLITGLAQIPGYYLGSVLIEKMERKWLIALFATAAALSALGVALARNEIALLVAAACLAACTNGVAGVYYAYTAELYPTQVRTTGMGAASAVGRLGAISAPIAIGYLYGSLGFTKVFLSLVVALAIAITVVVLFGPKTRGRSLEQVEEAEASHA